MNNNYLAYTYCAQNFAHACDDKILVDINRLNSIDEYDEVKEYVSKVWGEVDGEKSFDYPNNIKVIIRNKENCIEVGALRDNKQFFGTGWRLKD